MNHVIFSFVEKLHKSKKVTYQAETLYADDSPY